MSSIIDLMGPEHLELFALELKKNAIFQYTVSTNINQSAPNLVKIYYMTIRSQMSSIMDLIGPENLELFALYLKKMLYFTLFTL